jgi:hypothetical protein
MSLSAAEHASEKAKLGWSFGYKPGESPSGLRIVRGQHSSAGTGLPPYKPAKLYIGRK